MAGKEKKEIRRVVSVEFWRDDKVLDSFTPEDKLFMLYLLTNPQSTQIGVYNINKKTMAYELGYSVESITVLLDRFERVYDMIKYSPETHEVAIKNYLRHSILKGGKPVEDLLRSEMAKVKNKSLLEYVFENISYDESLNESVRNIMREFYAAMNPVDESPTNRGTNRPTNRGTNRGTNGTPSIINNQLSSNVVVVNNNNTNLRACACEGNDDNDDDYNPFGDAPDHPNLDTIEVYATNNTVNMQGKNMEYLHSYCDLLGEALVRYAIDQANKCCKTGVPTWQYVETILKGYMAQKIQTVEQAENVEANRKGAQGARSSPQRPTAAQESDAFWSRVPSY